MTRKAEKRSILVEMAEIRVDRGGPAPKLIGYACVYGASSVDLGGFTEVFEPGAFTKALAEEDVDVRYLVNHDPSLILGRTKAGTLTLVEDNRGLLATCTPPPTAIGEHYLSVVERGDITGMSFRFYVCKEEWNFSVEPPIRRVQEAEIDDVCLATYPAYPDSSAAVRMLKTARPKPSPRSDSLRERYQRLLETV